MTIPLRPVPVPNGNFFGRITGFQVLKFVSMPIRNYSPLPPIPAVNIHPSPWQTITIPPSSQPPPLQAVNLYPSSWQTIFTPPGGQPLPLLALNLHPSWLGGRVIVG